MVGDKHYYEVLGLQQDATDLDIKAQYRQLALKYHPDRNPNDKDAEEAFKEATEAYETLGDPIRRARYDLYGYKEERPIYEHLFNGQIQVINIPGGWRHTTLSVGFDIQVEYLAAPFTYDRRIKCEPCKGQGFLRESTCHCSWGPLDEDPLCKDCKGRGFIVKKYCTTCDAKGYYIEPTVFSPTFDEAVSRMWVCREGYGDWTGNIPGDLYYKYVGDDAELRSYPK